MKNLDNRLKEELFNKIPEYGNLVIFGACKAGEDMMKDIIKYKPETKILGFIDNSIKGKFGNFPIWTLKDFLNQNIKCDLVIMSTRTDKDIILNCFDVYDIPVLEQTIFISNYYRRDLNILSEDNFQKVINVFNTDEDKKLFEMIFRIRTAELDRDLLKEYHYRINHNTYHTDLLIKQQYLEKINKNAVKILLDAGFHNGLNVIAFNRLLPNIEKIYGFEMLYDLVRKDYIEEIITNKKLEIVPFALGDCNKKMNFYIDYNKLGASFIQEMTTNKRIISSQLEHRVVDVVTIDNYCTENNISPDFIKMDIEGAELSALKGGIETIKKFRSQLAISIYHSLEDFINIPQYLNENLEDYHFALGHYSPWLCETVLYAIPKELL